MNINVALIDKLIRLRNGDSLPASKLRGEWVENLLREGALISHSHGSRRSISASDAHQLEQSLMLLDERLGNMEQTRILLTENASRAEQASSTGNSKLTPFRSCLGFPVNSYEPIACLLNGKKIIVNPDEGSFLFVADWKQFAIPKDVVVVGIENMENFRLIRRQEYLFSSLIPHKHLLFVSRYPQSTDLRTWLKRIPNEYVHFGDFDLAGINIFLTEFHKHLGERASFLIPQDIEERLQRGSTERYDNQYNRFKKLTTDIPSLQRLIALINQHHRCYDQEGYILDLH